MIGPNAATTVNSSSIARATSKLEGLVKPIRTTSLVSRFTESKRGVTILCRWYEGSLHLVVGDASTPLHLPLEEQCYYCINNYRDRQQR
jgi:hypothetical protein